MTLLFVFISAMYLGLHINWRLEARKYRLTFNPTGTSSPGWNEYRSIMRLTTVSFVAAFVMVVIAFLPVMLSSSSVIMAYVALFTLVMTDAIEPSVDKLNDLTLVPSTPVETKSDVMRANI